MSTSTDLENYLNAEYWRRKYFMLKGNFGLFIMFSAFLNILLLLAIVRASIQQVSELPNQPMNSTRPIEQILNLSEDQIRQMTIKERWQLISILDDAVDQLQKTMVALGKDAVCCISLMEADRNKIRVKRLFIWTSMRSKHAYLITTANHLAA